MVSRYFKSSFPIDSEQIEYFFPQDLQLYTWQYFNPIQLCCLSKVCKSFYKSSTNDLIWKKFIKTNTISEDYKSYYFKELRETVEAMIQRSQQTKTLDTNLRNLMVTSLSQPKREYYESTYPSLFRGICNLFLKIIILGDFKVGKTSLLSQYVDSVFSQHGTPTIAVDFRVKTVPFMGSFIRLQLWDHTSDYERLSPNVRLAHGALLMGDLTDPKTLESIKEWHKQIEANAAHPLPLVVAFNKKDLSHPWQDEQLSTYLPTPDTPFFQTSVKKNSNLSKAMETLFQQILQQNFALPNICWDNCWPHSLLPDLEPLFQSIVPSEETVPSRKKKGACSLF